MVDAYWLLKRLVCERSARLDIEALGYRVREYVVNVYSMQSEDSTNEEELAKLLATLLADHFKREYKLAIACERKVYVIEEAGRHGEEA